MGDVLGGIGRGLLDILGGAHALKRQETEGFDWREKQAQAEWQRQRQRELAQQEDEEVQRKKEDALTGELSDIIAGAGEGEQPDLESMLPASIENERKRALIARAMGRGKERKSALQSQKLASDQAREESRQSGRLELLGKTIEGRQAIQDEKLAADREGREFNATKAMERLEYSTAHRPAGGRGGQAKPQLRSVWNSEAGKNEYRWLSPGEDVEGVEPGRPAAMVQAQGMAQGVNESIKRMEELANDVQSGPAMGRLSKGKQSFFGPSTPGEPPGMLGELLGESGNEGDFDFQGNAAVDSVYLKSGKQINEQEQEILRDMIPNRAKGNIPEQVRRFKKYSKYLLQKYGAYSGELDDATPSPRATRPTGAPKKRMRYNPATGRLE